MFGSYPQARERKHSSAKPKSMSFPVRNCTAGSFARRWTGSIRATSSEDFGIPHLAELPAIIWKRKNLETLRKSNHTKFAEQRKLLETLLAQS